MNNTARDEKNDKEYEAQDEHELDQEAGSSAADKPPGMPAHDDDSEVGDTDQHSTA